MPSPLPSPITGAAPSGPGRPGTRSSMVSGWPSLSLSCADAPGVGATGVGGTERAGGWLSTARAGKPGAWFWATSWMAALPLVGAAEATATAWPLATGVANVSVTVLAAASPATVRTALGCPSTDTVKSPGAGLWVSSRWFASLKLSTNWSPLTWGAAAPVVINAGGVVSGVSLFTAWPLKLAASLPAVSCTTLAVGGLVELTPDWFPLSTGRLRVSVMVLFAAFTLALSTVMGVLSGLVLVTVKPALPVRAAGSRLLAPL